MAIVRKVLILSLGLFVSACASVDTASRNTPLPIEQEVAERPKYKIASYKINVPRSLRVSEANRYYPGGDIVWRGDPIGDRHKQVAAIFQNSIENAMPLTTEGIPAVVDVELRRFHALTEKGALYCRRRARDHLHADLA